MSVQLNVIGSEQYVKKYCTEMNIKEYYMEQAIKIAKNIDRLNIITEHTQFSIAATSVLIMAELNSITNMTKKSLRSMFGVSNVTISKTYKKLEKIKHILIDDLKVDKLIKKINKLNDEQELSEDIKKRMKLFGIKCEEDDTNNIIINKQIDNNIIDNNIGYADNIILIKNVKNYKSDDTNLKSSEKPKKKNKTLNILSK
jgi:hypothetical protein